jgi:hypothetical protein
MKSSPQISLLQKTGNISQNNIIFEKKSELGRNGFILRRQKYPDFRFTCPNCGTLDVLLELQHFDALKGHCLECKIEWNEEEKQ